MRLRCVLSPAASGTCCVRKAAGSRATSGGKASFARLIDAAPEVPWVKAARMIVSGELARAATVLGHIGFRPGEAYTRLRTAKVLSAEGRRAEADMEVEGALAFYRDVGATRFVEEGEALLSASAVQG